MKCFIFKKRYAYQAMFTKQKKTYEQMQAEMSRTGFRGYAQGGRISRGGKIIFESFLNCFP